MRLALTSCSEDLADRLRSALAGEELVQDAPGRREPLDTCDAFLVSAGGGEHEPVSCADRVRALRRRHPSVPILALPVDPDPEAVIDVLDAGADAVAVPPLNEDELRLRLQGLLRRAERRRSQVIRYGVLRLGRLRPSASGPDGSVSLTPREHQILQYLVLNAERVVSRDEIHDAVWGAGRAPSANVLDVHLSHLRAKLEGVGAGGLVHTLRKVGLLFGSVDGDGAVGKGRRER